MSLEHLNKAIRHYEQNEYDKALPLFKQLAEQGAAEGQYNLGRMYLHGYGVTKDYQKAIEWFHKAVEQGNVDAQPLTPTDEEQVMFCEATIHYDRKEYDKAFLLYKQVAKGNYTELSFFVAMRLGKMYLDGKGTTKDEDEKIDKMGGLPEYKRDDNGVITLVLDEKKYFNNNSNRNVTFDYDFDNE